MESNYRLGKIYEKLGNKKKAITHLKNSLSIKQSHFESLLSLANILASKDEFERALKYYKHALLFKPEDPETLFGYSQALFRSHVRADIHKKNTITSNNNTLYLVSGRGNSELNRLQS